MPSDRSRSPHRSHRHKPKKSSSRGRDKSPHYDDIQVKPRERQQRHKRDYRGRSDVKRERDDDHRSRHRHDDRHSDHRPVDTSRIKQENPFASSSDSPPEEKKKADMKLSGKLTEDTNMYKGVVIKYSEPPEARKPKKRWRFYPFKGDDALPVLHLHRQSAYLLGRERKIADIPVDHPSCSKQHAVLQFRLVEYKRPDGMMGKRVRPYIIDLGSANGTFVNSKQIEAERYHELCEKDVIKFGFSSREYVLLHDQSDVSEAEDVGVD